MKMRTAVVRMQCVRLWMGTGYLLSVQVIYVPTHLRSRHSFAVACGACLLSHLLSIAHSRRRVHGNYGGMHQLPETLHRRRHTEPAMPGLISRVSHCLLFAFESPSVCRSEVQQYSPSKARRTSGTASRTSSACGSMARAHVDST